MRKAVIFANGEMPYPHLVKELIEPGDLLIAADGGLRHALALGLRPDHLMGDLDSIAEADAKTAVANNMIVSRFPPEKDQTDLELCLDLALREGCEDCLLVGAMGGRVDHALANIFLLFIEKYASMPLTITDGITTIGRADPSVVIHGAVGEIVTLLPWGGIAECVTTRGLRYALRGEPLYEGSPRGVSNEMLSPEAAVEVKNGKVLFIHIKNGEITDEN